MDITKAEIDTEFKISERYEAKARAFFGFCVVLFGITQAFVLRSDFTTLGDARRGHLELAIIVAGATFGVSVVTVMVATLQRSDRNFDEKRLFSMAREPATDLPSVVQEYIVVLGERRAANKDRLTRTRGAQFAAFVATLATAVEFVLAAIYFV